ncbi:MAG: BlaI/MecI/CopY family transcriptional regulator [Gemmatimonadales bacterium]
MSPRLTDRELDVMDVLWDRGSATVAEVRDQLADDLAYTTVLTILRTLEQKGHVDHVGEGKAHRYRPLVARADAGRSALTHLVTKLFDGSPTALVSRLVDDEDLSRADLREIRDLLDERLGRRGKK